MAWKKGESGNRNGRPPILLPEVQKLIERDRNAVRVSILQLLSMSEGEFQEKTRRTDLPMIERILCQCIDRIQTDGDTQKLKTLLEIPLGKLPADAPEDLGDSKGFKVLIVDYGAKKPKHD